MPTPLTQTAKNSLTITNASKANNTTWAEHIETWDETGPGGNTWNAPGVPITKDSKNNLTITNTTKN